ncbi:uncharacterized protein LOC114354948 [Ostrinia furnacalis]|uniref:uncharacterized protein LOC114354948 n=1 Tax=Ostrinia furnacalis TaxID=93504 RepID=UPI00103C9B37|nr:uncharacterized protein LOC114354948 [Ostrinia furnacalis]
MKVVLYFLVYSSVVLALFSAFMYLMTVVDPDLMDLPRKAALMSYHSGHSHTYKPDDDDEDNTTDLPAEAYLEYSQLLANITRNITLDCTAFVVGYSVVLLGLFGLCCYLMSTVNPKPLDELNTTDERPHDRRGYDVIPYPDDKDIFRTDDEDHLGYGLDKAKGNKALKVDQSVSHLIPLYRHLLRKGAFVNSSLVQDVVPPIIPSMQRTSTTTQRSVVIRKPNTNTTNPIAVKYPPVKGLRRSVNAIETNSIKDEESSGVILKIIDDSGRPRIEIKLGPNGSFEGNKLRYHRSSENETKSDVHDSNVTSHADEYDESNNKNTIIKILPNNTMVFEKVDHSLVSFNVVKEKPLGTEDYNVKNGSLSHDGDPNVKPIYLRLSCFVY